MDLPSTTVQLLIALIFVVPGSVYQAVRQRLRGPAPDDLNFSNKLFRALGVSSALIAIYMWIAGPSLLRLATAKGDDLPSLRGAGHHAHWLGFWAVTLLLLVPALLGLLDYLRAARTLSLRGITYSPIPRAWDAAFSDMQSCYVRVLTSDGEWSGGWYGPSSFISSFPEPREIYLETAHLINTDGSFGEEVSGSRGIYIRCDDVRSVEFVSPPVPSEQDEEAAGGEED